MNQIFTEGFPYLLLFLYLWIMVIAESSQYLSAYKKYYFIFSSILLWLFIGCRWETGTDWESYKQLFDTLELDWSFLFNVYHFDIGYVLLNALVRLFTDEYSIFLIINAGITIYLLSKLLLKTSQFPNLSLAFFYTNFMIAQFMGSNRRMMAMVFALWGFYFIYKARKSKALINMGLAFCFHRASIINVFSWLIPRSIFSIKQVIIILLLSLCIGLLQIPAKLVEITGTLLSVLTNNPIVEKMLFYSENNEEHLVYATGNLYLSTLLAVAKRSILLILYMVIIRKNKVDRATQFFYNIYIIGFAGYLLFIGSFFQMLTAFFTFIEVILIGKMYSYIPRKGKILFCALLLFYGVFQMLNALNVYPDLYMPYLPFWTGQQRI